MPFSLEREADTVVVAVDGPLVTGNRVQFKQLVLDQVTNGGRQFRVDFTGTGYIDSSGLGVLVSVAKVIRQRGGEIRLANLNPDLRTLFALTKLDTLFRLDDAGGDGLAGRAANVAPPSLPTLRQGEAMPREMGDRPPS